ncbi:PITH domain-containing protein GA19395-like [Mytilus trossulus]|uniref:PITH domain-containing protein GA19395-like n=1 Tax=Mytilus trossulus TaxID=6551 RepID=UPI0030068D46
MPGHGHSHGEGGCEHDHDHTPESDLASSYSLYLKIDTEKVTCLNESTEESGKHVFKPWDKRMDKEKFVESDADEELLFNIPFTGNVKLKGIILIGGEDDTHPNKMRLFKNRANMTFDDISADADQEFELHPDTQGVVEYNPKVVRFSSVHHLTIHFPSNFGADNTKVYYIGLKGDFTEAHRHEVTICTYEARAMPQDHKANAFDGVNHQIS